jgi:hypothetical protein
MTAADLTPFAYLSAVIAWVCAIVLVRLARRAGSRALTERAWVAVYLAAFTLVYVIGVYNLDHGFILYPQALSVIIIRLAFIGMGLIPALWLINWRWRTP